MSVELPEREKTQLEHQQQELFGRAAVELLKDMHGKHSEGSEDDLQRTAAEKVQERWKSAKTHYRGAVDSRSVPERKAYGTWEGPDFIRDLEKAQRDNAERIRNLWSELESYFFSGSFYGASIEGEPHMSRETARELVILLAKLQGYR